MICVTRFNGTRIYLNAEMIQSVEGTPDTVITLTNNTKVIVSDVAEDVVDKVITYQRLVHNPQLSMKAGT